MSILSDKINSYAIERGVAFEQAYANPPTQTGSLTPTVTTLTLSGTAPTYSTNSPPNGGGSWAFISGARLRSNVTTWKTSNIDDNDYTAGIWFMQPGNTSPLSNGYSIFGFDTAAGAEGFNIRVSGGGFSPPNKLAAISGSTTNTYGSTTILPNTWYFFSIIKESSTNNYKFYINGVLEFTITNAGTTNPSYLSFGTISGSATTYYISNFFYAPSSAVTEADLLSIYNTGTQSTGTDITITETPATATNAHFPEPVISTTIGVSFGTEPGTANAEAFDPFIFGDANYEHSFAIASALLALPTLAFTFNDNIEVVTSITVSAEFIEPFSFGGQVSVSTSAQLMEASATTEQHTIVAGTSISYSAELVGSASALSVEPFKFGPDDANIFALPMIASNGILQGTAVLPMTYYKLVKDLNPIYYVRDWTGGNATLLNEGSKNFGTVDKGPSGALSWNITQAASGEPMSGVGDGTSPSHVTGSADQNRWRYIDEAVFPEVLADLYVTKNFTHEWWYKPVVTSTLANNSSWSYTDKYLTMNLTHTLSVINLSIVINSPGAATEDQTYTFAIPSSNFSLSNSTWHHIVVAFEPSSTTDMKVSFYINNLLLATQTKPLDVVRANIVSALTSGTGTAAWSMTSGVISGLAVPVLWDEVAVYETALSPSQIQSHYNFIDTLSPNRTIFADSFDANATFPEPNIIREENRNFPATPITGSALFVDPAISSQVFVNFTTTAATASALSVNPSFYGTPDYRKNAEVLTVFAEMSNNNFALDDTYYSYVQTNIAPFRYVTFDGSNPASDYGTDNDYAVVPTVYGGTVTLPSFGINNVSIKTAGTNYTTDGVILKESEWNDSWGTGANSNHSSFWIKRAGDDQSSSGIRVLWNLNGYKDNQHIVLYQSNNKLHLQFNNGLGTFIDQATVADVNLFDYERHHVVIGFNHINPNNNIIKLYVDGVLVMTVNLGSYTGTTTNYATAQPANDEAYNHPRLGVGCLITPFASTALSSTPINTKVYVDEIHYAVTGITDAQVLALYNAMPMRDSVEWYADFFLATNATLVNPTFGAGCTIIATPLTASAEGFVPVVSTEFSRLVGADPLLASAQTVEPGFFGDDVRHINFAAEFMLASAFLVGADLTSTIGANAMLATAYIPASLPPWYDPYRALIIQQSITYPAGDYYGFKIGDID